MKPFKANTMHFYNDRQRRNTGNQNSNRNGYTQQGNRENYRAESGLNSFRGSREDYNSFEDRDFFERPDMPYGNIDHFEGNRYGNEYYNNNQEPYSGNLNVYNPRNNPSWNNEPYMREWTADDHRKEYPYHEEFTGEYYRGHGYMARTPEAYESYPGEYEMSRRANYNRNDDIENPRGRFGEEMYYWDHAENVGPGAGNRRRYDYSSDFRKYNMKGKRW